MTVKGEDFWMDELECQLGKALTPTARNYLRTWLRAFAAHVKRQCPDELDALLREGLGETREAETFPIPLNDYQERAVKQWAADDRLWSTQETVEFNLRTFTRTILAVAEASATIERLRESADALSPQDGTTGTIYDKGLLAEIGRQRARAEAAEAARDEAQRALDECRRAGRPQY